MTTRSTTLAPEEFYHVYNRGTDKRVIYQSKEDYARFLDLLFVSNSKRSFSIRDIKKYHSTVYEIDRGEQLVSIGAFCLMPNHFHVLLHQQAENGISKFMQKLTTGYTMYFNKKYKRSGSLMQGVFKSQHANSDEYLKYLFAYIHLNPVKLIQSDWKEQGIRDADAALTYAKAYRHSSLPDYVGLVRPELAIITPDSFPAYFLTAAENETNLLEWITFDRDVIRKPEVSPRDNPEAKPRV